MKKKFMTILLLLFCVFVFLRSGKAIYDTKIKNTYQEVQDMKRKNKTVSMNSKDEEVDLSYLEELKKENEDTKGWITIEGTKVNYPIVLNEDPMFYHRRNFKKEHDINGSIYLDARTPMDNNSNLLILYGHNMKTGAMFGEIENYKEEEFLKNHQKIIVDNELERSYYLAVAYFKLNGPMESDNFIYETLETNNTNNVLQNIIENAISKDMEMLNNILDIQENPKWIGLLSCDEENNKDRIMVLGLLAK